jgi:excisionase family DNA binding protein
MRDSSISGGQVPDSVTLLDRNEAAERLHVSPRTVRRYGKTGLLEERRVGPRLVRITAESVEALLRGDIKAEALA